MLIIVFKRIEEIYKKKKKKELQQFFFISKNSLRKKKKKKKKKGRALPMYTKCVQQEHQHYKEKEHLSIRSIKNQKKKSPNAFTHSKRECKIGDAVQESISHSPQKFKLSFPSIGPNIRQ
jgi:hypothetical protein